MGTIYKDIPIYSTKIKRSKLHHRLSMRIVTAIQFLLLILAGCLHRQIFTLQRIILLAKPMYSSPKRELSSSGPLFGIKYSSISSIKPVLSWISNFQISKQLSGFVKPVSLPSNLPVLGFGFIFGTLFITLLTKLLSRNSQQLPVTVQASSKFVEVVASRPATITEPIKVDIQLSETEDVPTPSIPSPPSPPVETHISSSTHSSIPSSTSSSTYSLPSFPNPIKKWGNKGKGSRWSPGSLIKPMP